jgi:hypothetical protein
VIEVCGEIAGVATFAAGKSTRELPRLGKLYGPGRWRKRKGYAEVKLHMRTRRARTVAYAVCLRNRGYAASLEVRKLYPVVDDPEAAVNDLIRVIDESGEDYLYPANLFRKLTLPIEIQRALRLAS